MRSVGYHRGGVRVKRRFPPAGAHRGRPRLSRGPAGVVPAPHAVKRAAPIVEQQARSPRKVAKHREDHRALRRFNLLRVARVGHRLFVPGDEPNVAEDGVRHVLDPVPPDPEPPVREGKPVRRHRRRGSVGGRKPPSTPAAAAGAKMRVPGRGRIEALHRLDHLRDAAEVPAAVHREEQDDFAGGFASVLRGAFAVGGGVGGGGFEGTRGRGRV
mmetsp:Transcript_8360/g.33722  ORF Transcript_8360/g.33722 Transcript_8360/m.33722 type:complete len:214 (+) Transcript_8360:490-1131(+)